MVAERVAGVAFDIPAPTSRPLQWSAVVLDLVNSSSRVRVCVGECTRQSGSCWFSAVICSFLFFFCFVYAVRRTRNGVTCAAQVSTLQAPFSLWLATCHDEARLSRRRGLVSVVFICACNSVATQLA